MCAIKSDLSTKSLKMETAAVQSQDPFVTTIANLFTSVLTKVTPDLETEVGQWFEQDTCNNIDPSEDLPIPPSAAFYNHTAWSEHFRAFLQCEKYQKAIEHLKELLSFRAESTPANDEELMILNEKVLSASFAFLLHAYVDFQRQQEPEDDIDQSIIHTLYSKIDPSQHTTQRKFLHWAKEKKLEIITLCIERIRDTLKDALASSTRKQDEIDE